MQRPAPGDPAATPTAAARVPCGWRRLAGACFDEVVDALAVCGHWLGTFGRPWL